MALSAAVVPALVLGLVALERTDTGPSTPIASDSLQPVVHRSTAAQSFAAAFSSAGFFRWFTDRRMAPAPPSNGDAGEDARAAEARGEAALDESERARCRRAARALQQAIRQIERVIDRFGDDLPPQARNQLERLLDRLERQRDRIIERCRPPSGVRART